MSRKKGSKNSLPKGVDWTIRVCTTLIVTTDGPTRCDASTIAVRRVAVGSGRGTSSAAAARGSARVAAAWMPRAPPLLPAIAEAPSTIAPRRRNPHTTPQIQVLFHCGSRRFSIEAGSSTCDIQSLLGKPSQPGIADPHEIQTMSGRWRRRTSPIASVKRRADGLRPSALFRGAKNRRYDAANHSVQEAIGHDVEPRDDPAPRPPELRHVAPRVLIVPALFREAEEVVGALKRPRGAAERLQIRADRARPRVVSHERGGPRHDQVAVRAAHGPEPGVEVGLGLGRLHDSHVPWKMGVQGHPEPLRREPRVQDGARDLPRCVTPRIG